MAVPLIIIILFVPLVQSMGAVRVYGQLSFSTNFNSTTRGGLKGPNNVYADANGVWIADTGNGRGVYYPLLNTNASQVFAASDFINQGSLVLPFAICVGDRFVYMGAGNSIFAYNRTNTTDASYPTGQLVTNNVIGVAHCQALSNGDVWASNTAGSGGIWVVNSTSSVKTLTTGTTGGYTSFWHVESTTLTYVITNPSGIPLVIALNGTEVFRWTSISGAYSIAVDSAGNVYISYSDGIDVFPGHTQTATRRLVNRSSTLSDGIGLNAEVFLDSTNGIYVGDTNNNRVLYFNAITVPVATTTAAASTSRPGFCPTSVCVCTGNVCQVTDNFVAPPGTVITVPPGSQLIFGQNATFPPGTVIVVQAGQTVPISGQGVIVVGGAVTIQYTPGAPTQVTIVQASGGVSGNFDQIRANSSDPCTVASVSNTAYTTTSVTVTLQIGNSCNGGLSTGAIIGIAVGCGVAAITLVLVMVLLMYRKRKRDDQSINSGLRKSELGSLATHQSAVAL